MIWWIVISNSNACRIYQYDRNPKKLSFIKELIHPSSKLKDIDLVADRQGHYQTSDKRRGSYSPRQDPKEVEIDNFSRTVANEIDAGRKQHSYNKLLLAAAPHMNGLIHQHLDEHAKALITRNLIKDYSTVPEHMLLNTLQEELQKHYPTAF